VPLHRITAKSRSALVIVLAGILFSARIACAGSSPASFAYMLQAEAFAPDRTATVNRLAACGRDWLILDAAFGDNRPWTRTELDTIRRGRPGRKIISYLSIGEAEEYRLYWRKEWASKGKPATAAPEWLGTENPQWKGNYRVKYWRAEWQKLILAALDNAMASGFDGVYLDIVDAFETFERKGDDYRDDRVNPETGQTYRRDMVDWVKIIAARARAKNPNALIIPQNGSQLLQHADFLEIISAIGIEDLFTEGDKFQPKSHTAQVIDNIKLMPAAQKPVLVIEYPTAAKLQEKSKKLAHQNGLIWLVTDRQLKTLGGSGK
jgi:cysteinyl-tRNA synthetase, unknown class